MTYASLRHRILIAKWDIEKAQRDDNASINLYSYRQEAVNVGGTTPKTRMETGGQVAAAMPLPVPVSEVRILKRATHHESRVV